ncbi:MAG: hypothetical protein ACR2H2_11205 [Solirubrobacteraceae bacterium]
MAGSQPTLVVGRDPAKAMDTQPAGRRCRVGRAYRAGRLVCGCVHVTVSIDGRLGLTQRERRLVLVRVHEPLDDGLRRELALLVRRRGAAARRVAEELDAIELVVDDPLSGRERIVGRLLPPLVRHGQLRDIEFGVRELEPGR